MWNDQFGIRSPLSSWVQMRWAQRMNYEGLTRLEHQIADLDETLARLKGQIHHSPPTLPVRQPAVWPPHKVARLALGPVPALQRQSA